MNLGDRVRCWSQLEREIRHRNKRWVEWERQAPITGILVGVRYLQNGRTVWNGPEESLAWKMESTVKAGLVATALHKRPVPVPFDKIHLEEANQ